MPKRTYLAAYVPVLHKGYIEYFLAHPKVKKLYIFDQDLLAKVDYLRKDLRAIEPKIQIKAIEGLGIFKELEILNQRKLRQLDSKESIFIFPDEDISREVAKDLKLAGKKFYPIFLRWDRRSAQQLNEPDPDEIVSLKKRDQLFMGEAIKKAPNSSDIWRRIAAVLVDKNGKVIGSAVNRGEPEPQSPWMEGDPRNIFNRGVSIEMSVFTHSEAALIAEAAKHGAKTKGASLYVSNFPCPACAKLIAHSGIMACYYAEGYSVLDGKRVLTDYGVKIVKVGTKKSADNFENPAAWVPYKKS
ncbi:hypothetical protein KW794_00105 [Candidatus Saccharibacteria bacterium]|nr:hypothetical protein [Candidatus Saccharibacteria bacterium]